MAEQEDWTVIASYAAVHQAELAVGLLHDAGIPARLSGEFSGIFGGAWSGTVTKGVDVLVPAARAEEARTIVPDA